MDLRLLYLLTSLINSSSSSSLSLIRSTSLGGWKRLERSSLSPASLEHWLRRPNRVTLVFFLPRGESSSRWSAVTGSMMVDFSATWYSTFRVFSTMKKLSKTSMY